MKVNLKIVVLLIVCISLYSKADSINPPSEEQISKLAAAAWKRELPQSIDVTLYKEIVKPPTSEEEIRKMVEGFFNKAEGPKENLSGWDLKERDRTIQMNVENILQEQEAGRRVKKRIRIGGHRQRIDQVSAHPKKALLKGTPHERINPEVVLEPDTPFVHTYINTKDPNTGDFVSYHYAGDMNTAFVNTTRWKKSDIINFAGLAFAFRGLLGVNEGTLSEPVFVPDPSKMEKLRKTGLVTGVLRLTINPDPNNPDTKDRIEIKKSDHSGGTILICDRENYSYVYYQKFCMPTTGKPLYVREYGNFDSQGFPRNITEIQYDIDGNFKEKSVYRIVKVELNPSIPDEVFEFRPPKDYKVQDLRSKKP